MEPQLRAHIINSKQETESKVDMALAFENSKSVSSDTPLPIRPQLLILSKQFQQLLAKYSVYKYIEFIFKSAKSGKYCLLHTPTMIPPPGLKTKIQLVKN